MFDQNAFKMEHCINNGWIIDLDSAVIYVQDNSENCCDWSVSIYSTVLGLGSSPLTMLISTLLVIHCPDRKCVNWTVL